MFKSGIVRMLSNFTIYEIKRQYLEDPNRFNKKPVNVHDPECQRAEEDDEKAAGQVTDPKDLPIF